MTLLWNYTVLGEAFGQVPNMISALTEALTQLAAAKGVKTSRGVLLTDDAVERLAAEAEAGYDVEQLKQSAQSTQEVEEQPGSDDTRLGSAADLARCRPPDVVPVGHVCGVGMPALDSQHDLVGAMKRPVGPVL